ncbi:hypothetical protein GCM10029992_37950 [Glycomyces albus]
MTTPTHSLRPGTALATITRFGHDFTVTTDEADRLVLENVNGRGRPHRTGLLTWHQARDTFIAEWHPDAYPRVEPGSLLAIGLEKAARLLRHRAYLDQTLPNDAGIVLAEGLGVESAIPESGPRDGVRP